VLLLEEAGVRALEECRADLAAEEIAHLVADDLKDIRKGAEVLVRDSEGKSLRFTVTDKETVSKKAFPTERVYGATKGSTLRLVTCDGAFDAEGHPVDNLIVYAELS
ncbi:class F sortase, partial [Streptomyces microflavus]|uniref:class F sortase n=1 Tax=Streptomyces microflavus TaxID=1919 RepID=UPI0033A945FB